MEKKWVALIMTMVKVGFKTTFYSRRVGEKSLFDSKEDAVAHAANNSKKMYFVGREEIVNYGWREATKKEIKDWEAKYGT